MKKTAPLPNTTAPTPEAAYWNWHNSEPLADSSVDRENVPQGPRYWERMLEAGIQAVADRKEQGHVGMVLVRSINQMGGLPYAVPFGSILKFGKRNFYGDNRQMTIGELYNGEIVSILHRDQPMSVRKAICLRVRQLCAIPTRDTQEARVWE